MAKISKYVKVHKDILLEYIYNDGNLIGEAYDILVNTRDQKLSYIAGDTSGTGNVVGNQLFKIDQIANKYGKIDTNYYSFLQLRNYGSSIPVRHDTIKVHLPINYTFGEYLGFYIRVYAFDYQNRETYDLSNFYFDMTDVGQQHLLNFSAPPLLFQEKLWGKNVQIEIPAVSEVAAQRVNDRPKDNSINSNLTNGTGLSLTAPVFIEYQFITAIQTINGVTTYLTTPKTVVNVPQSPEFEKLGVVIAESTQGDFFEIYGTYNDSIGEFNQFINNSVQLGNRYYVQYNITMYEQNIRGKTSTFTVTDNFNETIEFRPIIKYSTTTAIIDVEMRLIDAVDESYIIRMASFGMLQDQTSKYSLSLMKINLKNAYKPKIYNIKNSIDPSLVGTSNALGMGSNAGLSFGNNVVIETVKVPFPVLIDRFNIVAKSDNVRFNAKVFYGIGKLQILIFPFDNIINFVIATGDNNTPQYMDMTNMGEIKLVIKNDQLLTEFPLYTDTGEVNLAIGQLVFKVAKNKFNDIKRIYESGITVFYITSTSQGVTTVVYSGLYKVYDSLANVNSLNSDVNATQAALSQNQPTIIKDNSALTTETAIVTRKLVSSVEANRPKVQRPSVNVNANNASGTTNLGG
jgi:hypothetical protein